MMMTKTFDSWYLYDEWLTSLSDPEDAKSLRNYNIYKITKISEFGDGKLEVEMEQK